MKTSRLMGVVSLSFLVLGPALSGCSVESAESNIETSGKVSMALTGITNGTQYRLNNAVFEIMGPTSVLLASSNDPAETVLSAELAVGDYESLLSPGWSLQRSDGGSFVNVQATLVSPNPTPFAVTDGGSTSLVYQFDTDGTVISIGSGSVDISIAVDETEPNPACMPFGPSTCPMNSWCVPGSVTGGSSQCLAAGPLAIGEACDGSVACVANALCGNLPTGPVCVELCPPTAFGEVCPGGGLICQDIGLGDLGACL